MRLQITTPQNENGVWMRGLSMSRVLISFVEHIYFGKKATFYLSVITSIINNNMDNTFSVFHLSLSLITKRTGLTNKTRMGQKGAFSFFKANWQQTTK